MSEFFRRLRYLICRRRFDAELANDMEFHREMAAQAGGGPFGNTLRLREEARDAWGWTWIDRLMQDLRYASRMLRHSPGFTLAATLMLAMGIGANVAAFGFFDLMVFRPLSVHDPDTLLRFQRRSPDAYAAALPYPEMAFFREHSRTLSAVLALNLSRVAVEGEEKPLNANFVTSNVFTELNAVPNFGRMLDPVRDEIPGADPVVVLSYGFWQRHFGGDPSITGKSLRLNGKPATVIGIATREFSGLSVDNPDVWLPLIWQPHFVSGSRLFTDFSVDSAGVKMWGRLKRGVTAKAAEEELKSLAAELYRQHPDGIWKQESLPSEPGSYAAAMLAGNSHGSGGQPVNELVPISVIIGALVLLILTVACGNLGSLLLARGVAREREIAIRVAVGAGRGRLIRQLFTESLLLALLGVSAGLGVGYLVLRSLMLWTGAPAWLSPTPDRRVIVFATLTGIAAALLFGLMPALQISRGRHRASLTRQFLIGTQVAGSCVLLIVAALLLRALDRAITAHPGFEFQQVVSIDPALASHGFSPATSRAYLETVKARLQAVPGVQSVALASIAPLGHKRVVSSFTKDGRRVEMHINRVDPAFFQTMQIPLLRGRNLTAGETNVVVVSESLAQRLWPGQDPLGKELTDDGNYTVAGIAGNARAIALEDPDAVEGYFPVRESDLPSMVVLVKTSGPPEGLAQFMASTARSIDAKVFPEVELMKSSFQRKLKPTEYGASVLGVLGGVALLLACFGIVGLVAYAVSQRTKEIGIRMALGAQPSHVLLVVLRQFSRPVAAGLICGVGAAAALSQLLRRELYGISNLDPLAYVAAIGLFLITAAAASLIPARRALRVDPLRALRYE